MQSSEKYGNTDCKVLKAVIMHVIDPVSNTCNCASKRLHCTELVKSYYSYCVAVDVCSYFCLRCDLTLDNFPKVQCLNLTTKCRILENATELLKLS